MIYFILFKHFWNKFVLVSTGKYKEIFAFVIYRKIWKQKNSLLPVIFIGLKVFRKTHIDRHIILREGLI